MSVLLNRNSQILVQGITGNQGGLHTRLCRAYAQTKIVAGITPGKGGQDFEGIPVFNFIKDIPKNLSIGVSLVFVPAPFAADAILEAIEAEIPLVVAITEGIPILDMARVWAALKGSKSRLIGPNCPGIITPGEAKVGIMPGDIHLPGKVGVVSRSGTLTYEAVDQLTRLGLGQSTCIGIGGDPVHGLTFRDVVELFNQDPATEAIVMIGEIGGAEEEEAADYAKAHVKKPMVAFIAGQTAPKGRRMGHAGAIISGGKGAAKDKIAYLEKSGIEVALSPADIGKTLQQRLANKK